MRSILIAETTRTSPRSCGGVARSRYETAEAADGHTALLMARSGTFDLVLLDIGLGAWTDSTCSPTFVAGRRDAGDHPHRPDSVIDTVRGLESGANDYVTSRSSSLNSSHVCGCGSATARADCRSGAHSRRCAGRCAGPYRHGRRRHARTHLA
ncbi:hypothetical protein JM654_22190 [Microbacterium oxydans]|nr:hypothetical protein [Microbacterium oxydans]